MPDSRHAASSERLFPTPKIAADGDASDMSPAQYGGPKLPRALLNEVGHPAELAKGRQRDVSRKDKRKAARQDKKSQHADRQQVRRSTARPVAQEKTVAPRPKVPVQPVRPILKKPQARLEVDSSSSSEDEATTPAVSRAVKRQLEQDDAEIAALEKKLGIKSKKSKVIDDDELDFLVNGSDGSDDGKEQKQSEYDDWLKAKRQKAMQTPPEEEEDSEDEDEEEEEMDSDMEGLQNPFSDDELSSDDFDDDDESEEEVVVKQPVKKKKKENPYVAPVSKTAAARYVPPSLRKLGQGEDLTQLRRQIQGQFNRLSEANFLSILSAVEGIYASNARQHVTMILVELFTGLVNSPSALSEQFLILHSAFAAAIYKVTGPDFGAQLLEKLVELAGAGAAGKQVLNMLGFLANLYIMQLVGANLVFDYIRQLLNTLSEDNTELLLRIVRTAGVQLRQDDPTALKDIVVLLTRSVAATGEDSLSVRTKFMIETINDLKNNKMKAGTLAGEHAVRMKKTLGTLNSRTLRATEPLQVTLADLENVEKKGKWWLVGASYLDPAKHTQEPATRQTTTDDGYESETPGHVSLTKLAKAQGMNTDVRRAIFVAIMSATDYQDAHLRIIKLHLNNKQTLEVAKVLLHCAGAESVYNPYYTIIAKKLCSEPRLQKSMVSALWDVLRKVSGEEEELGNTHIINTARMYGALMADDLVSVTTLKTLEFALLPPQAQTFAEVLMTTIMVRAYKSKHFEQQVEVVFAQAASAPRLSQGLQIFLRDVVFRAEITNTAKETEAVKLGCELAIHVMATAAPAVDSDNDMDSSDSD